MYTVHTLFSYLFSIWFIIRTQFIPSSFIRFPHLISWPTASGDSVLPSSGLRRNNAQKSRHSKRPLTPQRHLLCLFHSFILTLMKGDQGAIRLCLCRLNGAASRLSCSAILGKSFWNSSCSAAARNHYTTTQHNTPSSSKATRLRLKLVSLFCETFLQKCSQWALLPERDVCWRQHQHHPFRWLNICKWCKQLLQPASRTCGA